MVPKPENMEDSHQLPSREDSSKVGPADTSNIIDVVPTPAVSSSHASTNDLGGNRGHLGVRPSTSTHELNKSQQQQHQENSGTTVVEVDNPFPHTLSEGENATPLEVIGSTATDKLVIIMVGLPATGKTHISKRICRFLSFFHDIPSQIFNVGDYRRQLCGTKLPASFYNPNNPEGSQARQKACDAALEDLITFMKQDGVRVAAFDATNTTRSRRKYIVEKLKNSLGRNTKRMFIESICDSTELLEENIRKVKLSTPDYQNVDPTYAVSDFKKRIAQYSSVYDPLNENDDGIYPYVKIINCRRFIVNNIRGYLPLKVVHFVMNLHTLPRTFFLTRHGQSEYNLLGKIGGDSSLTDNGIEYAKRLAVFAQDYIATGKYTTIKNTFTDDSNHSSINDGILGDSNNNNNGDESSNNDKTQQQESSSQEQQKSDVDECPARLWTSTLRRTKETAQFIKHNNIQHTWDNGDKGDWMQFRPMSRRNLDELYAGTCDGMTYKEIEQHYPIEFKRRQNDKLAYRYPRGESYMDVTLRLEPLAHEMERTREPILIIGHQGILRIIYAYFMGLDRKDAPYVSIPLNNVIELSPHAYGCNEKRFCLMTKEEMTNKTLIDGQDEPITSMPMPGQGDEKKDDTAVVVPGDDLNTYVRKDNIIKTFNDEDSTRSGETRRESLRASISNSNFEKYDPSDAIMNAPSC